ncbi:DUF192 domain-containing protein [Roseibium sp. MMSF_3412]|uniref:DUF192 domain-containing protein n=1 Tax=Roseibium sp. MMSF_3412 TaxID=3046712 RepID=UPI00273DAE9C|nr:DUF192 domain-containing protein [Roseibium sp. MMSF_3412]
MPVSRVFRSVAKVFLALFLVTGLTSGTFAQDDGKRLRTEPLTVESAEKTHRFTVEVAVSAPERSRGLMFREEMAADDGMLFIFEKEGDRYFWMKNTPLPLDIIYIDAAGKIVSIAADTTPFSEQTIPSGAPAKYVLELNAGTSAERGIVVGDTVSSASMTGG